MPEKLLWEFVLYFHTFWTLIFVFAYHSSVNTIFQFSLIFVFNSPQVFVIPTDNGNPSYWYSFISLSFTTKCISFKVIWRVLLLKWGWLVRISVCGCQYRVQHWQSISKEEFTNLLPYSASIKITEFQMSAVSSHVSPFVLFAWSHKWTSLFLLSDFKNTGFWSTCCYTISVSTATHPTLSLHAFMYQNTFNTSWHSLHFSSWPHFISTPDA